MTTTGHPSWRQSALLALAALLLFCALPQQTLHGVDGQVFVGWIEQGRHDYPRHVAYLHLAGLVHGICAPYGMSAFASLLLTSALGSALAVLLLHRAFALLLGGRDGGGAGPIAAVVAVAVTAPCWFYATCAEIHGVFAAGAAASWWLLARWFRSPTAAAALGLGAATGAAASIHAYGHLLLPTLGAAALALGAGRALGAQALRHLAIAGLAHGAVAIALATALGAGAGGQVADIAAFVGTQWQSFAPATAPDVALREWLWPCAPWSVGALLALWSPRGRPWALAALLGLLLHLPFTVLLLGFHQIDEGGAYHIALVPAAVLATRQLLRPREFAAAIGLAAALAFTAVSPEWRAPTAPAFVAAVESLNRERPMALIVGQRGELDGVRTGVRDPIVIDLGSALNLWLEERARGVSLATWFDGWFRRLEAGGRPLLLADSAESFFAGTPEPEIREFWDWHVLQHYLMVPEARTGFRGTWLVRAPGAGPR